MIREEKAFEWEKTATHLQIYSPKGKPIVRHRYIEVIMVIKTLSRINFFKECVISPAIHHPSTILEKNISKINILQWVGLPHSIPDFLKGDYTSPPLASPSFLIHNNIFDVTKKKSKDYHIERIFSVTSFWCARS